MQAHHLTLKQLRVIQAVIRYGSIARAAEQLHLTGPAVTQQIQQAERDIGMPLFDRLPRGMAATAAGERVGKAADEVLSRLNFLGSELDALSNVHEGLLRIGLLSTGKYFVPKLIGAFRADHPDIKLRLHAANREELVALIAQGEVDVAITGRVPANLPVVSEAFAANPQVVIAAPGHPLAGTKGIQPIDLNPQTFIQRESGSGTRAVLEEFFHLHRISPAETLTVSSNEMIKQIVMSGLGISIMSLHTLSLELKAGALVMLDVDHTPIARRWYQVHHTHRWLAPAAEMFWRFLQTKGAAMIAEDTVRLLDSGRASGAETQHPRKAGRPARK